MKRLYENAVLNASKKVKTAVRHDIVVKKFACSLYCLVGKSGYELISSNLATAVPSLRTVQRTLSSKPRIKEGEFHFDELLKHLQDWKSPLYLHIQLDDTRVINRVEYDQQTNRFIGFCLPLLNGLPLCDTFQLNTFEDIKTAVETTDMAKYAHCIIAQPIDGVTPPCIIFVLGTDSKYDSEVILQRWSYIESELLKRNIHVLSYGADGAGPFMKAMMRKTQLFTGTNLKDWPFFRMDSLKDSSLLNQDTVHLLAKLRNKLLTPSNLIALGKFAACPSHLDTLIRDIQKARHGLTRKAVDNKDKQNYQTITLLLDLNVESCLYELDGKYITKGTIIYLKLMRNIRDATFDKELCPTKRIYLIWVTVYFLRIWRTWLGQQEGFTEGHHFITHNAYLCIEINAHMIINTVVNVSKGHFPKDALRFWLAGSQACEQTFRLLRAMTPTFSTIVNFSVKGVLQRLHKLHFLASCESSDEIVFPRVQRRLLQLKAETNETFLIPTLQEIFETVKKAKQDAINLCNDCAICIDSYDDDFLLRNTQNTIEVGQNEGEFEDSTSDLDVVESSVSQNDADIINQDLAQIRLQKSAKNGFPIYTTGSDNNGKKNYNLYNNKFSAFVIYENAFIRKTTALYLIQENCQVSNDRLIRVRRDQPDHLFSVPPVHDVDNNSVRSGDRCIFRRVDNGQYILGRVIQFSYLDGSKRDRQYTSIYVDMTKDSFKTIGCFANWYVGMYDNISRATQVLPFKPLDIFTIGYLSMENHIRTLSEEKLVEMAPSFSFGIAYDEIKKVLPNWIENLTLEKFDDDV